MTLKETYAYDDVTLIPAYSELKSRSEANPSMHGYKLPIIASCMDVFGKDMMECITKNNIPFIAHRAFKSAEDQFKAFIPSTYDPNLNYQNIWFAVGSVQKYKDWINTLITFGVRKFCVDMAHGDSLSCIDTIKFLRRRLADQPETIFGKPHIIAGNVATPEGFKRLQKAGADGMRVGIASGQICFTPNTKVWYISPSGKMYQKEIQHIEVGDKVITASGRARKVVNKFINDYSGEIYKIEGENISATPTHKFYTFNTITHAKEFIEIANIDDRFMTFINAEGKTLEKQIDIDEYTGKVYNIEVEDEHTYAVGNSILGVSNCSTNLQCFPADTLVTTSRGLIKISELLPTDYVLTHTGEYEKINSFFEKEYNGDMIKINDILVTPDHPFFVINKEDESLITEENYKNYGYWLEAKYITKNHVLISLE